MRPAHVDFRELCRQHGLAVTHQREVIYRSLAAMHGHPSPEEVYAQVRKKVPAISLATVYKTIHTFLAKGILQEVSPHHGSLRVDANSEQHHHLVCTSCKSIVDVGEEHLEPLRVRGKLPGGFAVERFSVDILGLCAKCSSESGRKARTIPS